MTHLPVALFNYEDGGQVTPGVYDFGKLKKGFTDVTTPPWLILLCEAKEYDGWGKTGLLNAAKALSEQLDRPYVGELGWIDRGNFGPAIFYDPQELALLYWGDTHASVPDDKRNMARFRLRNGSAEFLVVVQHWIFRSGRHRLEEAQVVDRFGNDRLPVVLGGDLNATASGLHLPQRDWANMSYRSRGQKGRQLPDGTWSADTDALDHLIGRWDEAGGRRIEGCGFYAVAELAYQSGTPANEAFLPTVNTGVGGSELLIDWLLINRHFRLVPETYRVHVPLGPPANFPSNHRLVTATLEL